MTWLDTDKSEMSFSDCFQQYLKGGIPSLKKSTRQAYETRWKYFTTGPLPHVKMKEFKAQTVYNWMNWLKAHPTAKNKSRKTFAQELKTLKIILHWHRNFVDENFNVPITKKHKQLCYYKTVPPKRPDYYAKPEELREFICWLRDNRKNPMYWRLALFMVLTGARVGEACGLCWSAVDFKRGHARVMRQMAWEQKSKRPYLEETTKTSASARILLLPDELLRLLKAMRAESSNKTGLLFTDRRGKAVKYNAIQSSFNAGFMALGLTWRSTHILRHSYATIALIATKDLSAVQASLGHTSSRMTERYAKVIALLDRKTAEKTAKVLDIFSKLSK